MLTELCAELKNYFLRDIDADIHYGEYTISGGSIDLPLPRGIIINPRT